MIKIDEDYSYIGQIVDKPLFKEIKRLVFKNDELIFEATINIEL